MWRDALPLALTPLGFLVVIISSGSSSEAARLFMPLIEPPPSRPPRRRRARFVRGGWKRWSSLSCERIVDMWGLLEMLGADLDDGLSPLELTFLCS